MHGSVAVFEISLYLLLSPSFPSSGQYFKLRCDRDLPKLKEHLLLAKIPLLLVLLVQCVVLHLYDRPWGVSYGLLLNTFAVLVDLGPPVITGVQPGLQ